MIDTICSGRQLFQICKNLFQIRLKTTVSSLLIRNTDLRLISVVLSNKDYISRRTLRSFRK